MLIKSIDPQKMVLDDDSQWQPPLPSLDFPTSWKVGDEVSSEKTGGRFSLYRVINKTRKQETGARPASTPSDIKKTLGKDGSAEEYANLNTEITIKNASGELIWLADGSKWQMYNPALGNPGSWEIGDTVIVTWRVAKSMSRTYEMKNVKTGITLIAVFLGREQ